MRVPLVGTLLRMPNASTEWRVISSLNTIDSAGASKKDSPRDESPCKLCAHHGTNIQAARSEQAFGPPEITLGLECLVLADGQALSGLGFGYQASLLGAQILA